MSKTTDNKKSPAKKTPTTKALIKEIEQLKDELETAQQSTKDNYEQILRAKAEMENIKKRNIKEVADAHKYAIDGFAKELLVVLDSLNLGLKSAQTKGVKIDSVIDGMNILAKSFNTSLAKFGIKEINPQDETFNPDYHEAMTMIDVKGKDSNTIIDVMQVGFTLNDRLLRPAMVVIAK